MMTETQKAYNKLNWGFGPVERLFPVIQEEAFDVWFEKHLNFYKERTSSKLVWSKGNLIYKLDLLDSSDLEVFKRRMFNFWNSLVMELIGFDLAADAGFDVLTDKDWDMMFGADLVVYKEGYGVYFIHVCSLGGLSYIKEKETRYSGGWTRNWQHPSHIYWTFDENGWTKSFEELIEENPLTPKEQEWSKQEFKRFLEFKKGVKC